MNMHSLAPRIPQPIAERLVTPSTYGEWQQIHKDFSWLRADMPLAVAEPEGYDPFWVVTKHADVQEVGRQPQIFTNGDLRTKGSRLALISQNALAAITRAVERGERANVRSVVGMDAPEHGVFRKLTFADFAPKGVRGLEDDLRRLARESVDEMAARGGTCDFASDVAGRFPLRVILSILGIPRSDEDMMLRLTQHFFNPADKDLNRDGAVSESGRGSSTDFGTLRAYFFYFDDLTDRKRREPTNDIASSIANSMVNGSPIDHWDAASYYITILTAGHDTTSSSIAGGMWALAENPDLLAQVKSDPALIDSFVEEAIRWTTPINHFMRTAAQDYAMRGQQIHAGDWLMLAYPSATRDGAVYDTPDAFRLDRPKVQNLAFGFGAHVCLGQHLARLEMRVFFQELFSRLRTVELAGRPARNESVFVGGIKSVPVSFTLD